tara:strand:- start:150 stop:560 length:411 start_codon:yes stop_codon:yes gene_type:complete
LGKAGKTLNETRQELIRSERGRKELAAKKEMLVKMKADYSESLRSFSTTEDPARKVSVTLNFIKHLEQTITVISEQLEEMNKEQAFLKRRHNDDFRELKKFESLEARTRVALERAEEMRENKDRDLQILSRLSRKS